MLFEHSAFIGIAPTAGKFDIAYAAIDRDLRLLDVGGGDMESVIDFVSGQKKPALAISGPRQTNQGLMKQEDIRATLTPAPRQGRWEDYRVVEYLLHTHKIGVPRTHPPGGNFPSAMRNSFALFQRFAEMGFQLFPGPKDEYQLMEVNSYATYAVLLECLPFPKTSLEGRLQRQLKLYDLGLEIPDPMRIFEEFTRHKIMQGILPLERLYSPYELDALVSAYTAWTAIEHPERISVMGDPREGQIVLPAKVLKAVYQ